MQVKKIVHKGVRPNGTFDDQSGAVNVTGGIIMSQENGGCGLGTCHCSDGHWITISMPRTEGGIVEVMSVHFDNAAEMQTLFINRELRP
jgi:hypothetical protein